MDARTAGRFAAVQAIFEKDLNAEGTSDAKFLGSTFEQKKVNKNIFNSILENFETNKEAVDEIISANLSEKWKIERINSVLKSILRCGIVELKFMQTPKAVVVSEYLEIADSFVDENEVRFVNAILDKVEV